MSVTSIGGLPLGKPDPSVGRVTALIWGQVGVGKTPLAITAPPPILYMLFDPDGEKSVVHVRDRYELLDLSKVDKSIVDQLYKPGTLVMRDIEKAVADGQFKSIVFDSLTAYMDLALERGVDVVAPTITKGAKPTYIAPQMMGWGARATLLRMTIQHLSLLCAAYNVNLILTAHERIEYNDNGSISAVVPSLGGQANVTIPKLVSEIWLLRDVDRRRRIYVRNWSFYSPVRTRMFLCDKGEPEFFFWDFDANSWKGGGSIEHWLAEWREHDGNKIPMPK